MDCVVTICCKEKQMSPEPLPAHQRYLSRRIDFVAEEAVRLGLPFFIFSGKYGLLAPQDPIPYYDLLLKADQVPSMAAVLGEQLRRRDLQALRFHGWPEDTPGWAAYHEALRQGCSLAGVAYSFIPCEVPD